MKKSFYFSLALLVLFLQSFDFSQNLNKSEMEMKNVVEILDSLSHLFAPDKRTAIFEYKISVTDKGTVLNFKTNLPEAYSAVRKVAEENHLTEGKVELLPSGKLGEKVYALATLSVINLRTKPKHSAEMASQALLGTPMKVFEKKDNWYRVQTPDKYIAWTESDGIQLMSENEIKKWYESSKIIVTATCSFVYEDASVDSPVVSDLTAGDILVVSGQKGAFYKVKFPDEREGFVLKKVAQEWTEWLNSRILSVGDILSTAFKFMGVPYLWGGTSPKGLDCSGFTKTVYFLNGIILPRDASQQVLTGEVVPIDSGYKKFQPGDLLFFGKHATDSTKEKVTHVALYIGGGKFIHASGRVRINSLEPTSPIFSEYRYKTFLHARRVLSSINKNGIYKITKNEFYSGAFK